MGSLHSSLMRSTRLRAAERALAMVAIYLLIKRSVKTMSLDAVLNAIPYAAQKIKEEMRKEADKAVADLFPKNLTPVLTAIPEKGRNHGEVLADLKEMKAKDNYKEDQGFGLCYHVTDHKHHEFTTQAHSVYIASNALDPTAFPSLRKMEVEVCSMTLNMLHAPKEAVGVMTSGGTESILCAVKGYRDRARYLWPRIKNPEILLPKSAHVAFEKGAHYFGIKCVWVPLDEKTQDPDLDAMRKRITKNTILIVASAPQYPAGTMDPIEKISDIALEKGLPLHVDSCIGGFMLPFVEKLGHNVPLWDFRVSGVTSISADCHKYGYAPKGASVISWRNADDRLHQFHAFAGWPGGYYASPSLLGTRAGGPIAAAWASINAMGVDGYTDQAKKCMEVADMMKKAITDIPELELVGNPVMSILCFKSINAKIHPFALADAMAKKGWKLSRQQNPNSLHVTIMPIHWNVREKLIKDLRESVETVRKSPNMNHEGSAAMYGVLAKIPTDTKVADFLKILFSRMFRHVDA